MRMIPLVPAALAIGVALAASPAGAQPVNGITMHEVYNSYSLTGPSQRERTLQWLAAVCKSPYRDDRRDCAQAWQQIHAAHAKLQERKARAAGN